MRPGFSLEIYGPQQNDNLLRETVRKIFDPELFPVDLGNVGADIRFEAIQEGHYNILSANVETLYVNHPCPILSYRVRYKGHSMVYLTDHEPYHHHIHPLPAELSHFENDADGLKTRLMNFLSDAEVVIVDGQYTEKEYPRHKMWGHSSIPDAIACMHEAGVKHMVIHHHDPNHYDKAMMRIEREALIRAKDEAPGLKIQFAKELSTIHL